MTIIEVKQQLQEDLLSIVDAFDLEDFLDEADYENLKNALCDSVIRNLDKVAE